LLWQPLWLPKGFQPTSVLNTASAHPASSRAYSDGLAALTVFAEPLALAGAIEGSRKKGATLAVSRQLEYDNQLYLITVVGEVPMETAVQVAASVRFGATAEGHPE
jgi:sigma-E factor negative regulatory protein RseB